MKAVHLKLGLAILLIALVCSFGLTKPQAPSGAPYKIGAIFAITGTASSLGIPERNTAVMLERRINEAGGIKGHPVQIIVEDNKSEPAEAVNAAMRLIERDQVVAIVGPSRTGDSLAVAGVAEREQVPLLSCAAGIDIVEPVRKWVFKTPQSDRMAVQKIIGYLRPRKIRQVAVISDNSPFGKGGLKEIQRLMPAAGFQIVDAQEYGPTDTSMMTQLTKIKAARPQAVICWGTPPGPATIAKEMKQLAIRAPLICSHGVANETFLRVAGNAANGVVLPAGRLIVVDQIPPGNRQRKVLQQYAGLYRAEFHKNADTFGGHAWDAIQLVVAGLRKVGPDRAKLRDEIERTRGFVGTGGIFSFSPTEHNGLTKDAFVMVEVVDGEWKLIK